MTEDQIRERVLNTFMRYRVNPEAPFKEDHFMDYFLLNAHNKKHLTSNSFRGLRRRNSFIQEIEKEFAICFGNKDFEKSFSINSFVNRVLELRASPRSCRSALRARMNMRKDWFFVFFTSFILLSLAFATRSILWLSFLLLSGFILFALWAASIVIVTVQHNRSLARRLSPLNE